MLSLAFAIATMMSVICASTRLHNLMVNAVMRAPLSFFHTNPTGRIVNRFSKDLGMVDDILPSIIVNVFSILFLCAASVVLLSVAIPFLLPLVAVLLILFVRLRTIYVKTSREVKRYEGMTRSPIYAAASGALRVRKSY